MLKRLKHFRGHGVHSPLAYSLVREVFMRKGFLSDNRHIYNELTNLKVRKKTARQLQNLSDFKRNYKLQIVWNEHEIDHSEGTISCVLSPKKSKHIIENHNGMSIDKRSYTLLINDKNYRKQHFKL